MPEFYTDEEEDFLFGSTNDNYRDKGRYIIDINYNRPLKHFPQTLNKIDEVDESSIKSPETAKTEDENGNFVAVINERADVEHSKNADAPVRGAAIRAQSKCQKVRPKSANNAVDDPKGQKTNERRPRSSCAGYPSKIPVMRKDRQKKPKYDSDCSSGLSLEDDDLHLRTTSAGKTKKKRRTSDKLYGFFGGSQEFVSFHEDYPLRPKSACCMRRDSVPNNRKILSKRSNSQPNITREPSPQPRTAWADVTRFRRSLKLLGLCSSDFGLPDSSKEQIPPHRPRSSIGAPTFTTRVMQRSISLDCLKEVVREAASQSGVSYHGLPQRRLLAKAAYEEWYFKKCEQINRKMVEDREKSEKAKEAIEIENMQRREKASEHYIKWVEKKKLEGNKVANKARMSPKLEIRLIKSRDEIDKAYLEWKKKKQNDLAKKKVVEVADQVKNDNIRKAEKQKQAEKAFIEWKKKLIEADKTKKAKEKEARDKLTEQMKSRQKPSKSYVSWKEEKDNEIKNKEMKQREAARRALDMRTMTLTEREYEAEQAFEEWLEKVDGRRHRGGHIISKT